MNVNSNKISVANNNFSLFFPFLFLRFPIQPAVWSSYAVPLGTLLSRNSSSCTYVYLRAFSASQLASAFCRGVADVTLQTNVRQRWKIVTTNSAPSLPRERCTRLKAFLRLEKAFHAKRRRRNAVCIFPFIALQHCLPTTSCWQDAVRSLYSLCQAFTNNFSCTSVRNQVL